MLRPLLVTLSHALVLAGPLSAVPSGGDGADETDGRRSLEEMLEHFRGRRDQLLAELKGQVSALVAQMDEAAERRDLEALDRLRQDLTRLGPECAPLLLPAIDPGPQAKSHLELRARHAVRVLSGFPLGAVTDELLALLRSASSEGKRNALRVLAHTAEPERVSPAIVALFETAGGSLRQDALNALARIGGEQNDAFLADQLAAADVEVVRFALGALTEARSTAAAARVLSLASSSTAAAPYALEIAAFYSACPDVVDGAVCTALLQLARDSRTDDAHAVRILELLPRFERRWPSSFKKDLKAVSQSSNRKVSEAALIALALTNDRGAKRDLLEPYNRRVADQPDWARVWEERADIWYRIGDFKAAIRDFQDALKVDATNSRPQTDNYVGIARCYARMGKEKDAAKWLNDAPVSYLQLRALALDPVFAEMAANPRYRRDVFHLDD